MTTKSTSKLLFKNLNLLPLKPYLISQ